MKTETRMKRVVVLPLESAEASMIANIDEGRVTLQLYGGGTVSRRMLYYVLRDLHGDPQRANQDIAVTRLPDGRRSYSNGTVTVTGRALQPGDTFRAMRAELHIHVQYKPNDRYPKPFEREITLTADMVEEIHGVMAELMRLLQRYPSYQDAVARRSHHHHDE